MFLQELKYGFWMIELKGGMFDDGSKLKKEHLRCQLVADSS
jgi:hypothetical protein